MTIQSNLLPVSVRNRRFAVSSVKWWAAAWVVTALAAFYFCLERNRSMTDLETAAARVAAQAQPLRKIRAHERSLQKKMSQIRQRESWLTESDSGQTLQLLGIISHAACDNHGRISVETLTVQEIERAVEEKPSQTVPQPRKPARVQTEKKMQLDLNGIAVDDLAVASFVALLREAHVFESVELKSTLSEVVNNHEIRKYELSCLY